LAKELPRGRSPQQVQDIFYPPGRVTATRRADFLSTLDDKTYRQTCEHISVSSDTRFPDVCQLLKTTKDEGRIMMRAISHVVAWLNPNPTVVADRENNKPPLRRDFLPALKRNDGPGDANAEAEKQSLRLQRAVLDFVSEHMTEFKDPAVRIYLDKLPTDTDRYSERFSNEAWKGLLDVVTSFLGPGVPIEWAAALPAPRSEQGDADPKTKKTVSAITRGVRALLYCVPEVAQDPALNTKLAVDTLCERIALLVAEWAAEQCQTASLENQSSDEGEEPQPSETTRLAESSRRKYVSVAQSPPRNQPQYSGDQEGLTNLTHESTDDDDGNDSRNEGGNEHVSGPGKLGDIIANKTRETSKAGVKKTSKKRNSSPTCKAGIAYPSQQQVASEAGDASKAAATLLKQNSLTIRRQGPSWRKRPVARSGRQ